MASYKNRVKELETAIRAMGDLAATSTNWEKTLLDISKISSTMLKGGVLSDSKVTKTVSNLMSGKEIEIAVGTPLCCDPSSETYWSM
jgi:hypothetical protein